MSAEITSLGLAVWAVLVVSPPLLLPTLIIAWLLQAIALLAVPAPRQSTSLGMVLAVFGLFIAWFGLHGEIEEHLLGFSLGLLIAAVAWTGASDPRAKYLQAVTMLPPMGALLGVSGMAFALAIGLIVALLHSALSRALRRENDPTSPPATSLAIGLAVGTWLIWIYGAGFLFRLFAQ
jgi:leader peptidase (prepilin peptidase)/N-methyltransferase